MSTSTPALARQIEHWPISRLIPYARNARTHTDAQIQKVAASIREFGFNNPVLVDTKDGIIAGHARLGAAQLLRMDVVPVVVLDHLTETQKRAYILADNRLAELAGWDPELLRGELVDLRDADFNLQLMGWDEDELERLMHDTPEGLTDEDQVPAPLEQAVTRPGDLWVLGEHRLLCGDSANREDLNHLIENAPIDLVNTDPPYNVKVEPRSNNAIAAGIAAGLPRMGQHQTINAEQGERAARGLTHHQSFDVHRGVTKAKGTTKKMRPKDRALENDFMKAGAYEDLLRQWFGNIAHALNPGGSCYIWGGYANCANYPPALAESGLYFSQAIIWVKEHPVLTRKDFMGNHEWCFYGWREGGAHWFNPEITNATDVWSVKKVSPNAMIHLTEKPVELAARAMLYSSKAGAKVLDLFGGSGSTLIAAQKMGRKARLMEIDPPYCDVIIQRWQEYTGQKAARESGQTFDEARANTAQDDTTRHNTTSEAVAQ
jgi:DNA modification methylase